MDKQKDIKVLWVHNFINQDNNSGVFMYVLFNSFKSKNVDLFGVYNLMNPINFIKYYFKIRKLRKDYDIIHAQYGSATGFLVSLIKGKKILSLRGSDWYKTPMRYTLSKLHTHLGNLLTKFSINRFDSIIVMSNHMKSEVVKLFPNKNIEVIPDGIDLDKFIPLNEISTQKEQRVLFSTVDKNNLLKRFHLAEKSVGLLRVRMPDIEIKFMTGIPHSQVNEFINNADVIILTSTHEGWPNIIKEGLAANIPFVATEVSDLKEIASKTNSCFVCEPIEDKLAEALYTSLNSDREELRSLIEHMEVNNIRNQILDLYNDVLDSKPKHIIKQKNNEVELLDSAPTSIKSAKRRICHITTVHQRYDVRIFHKECKSLTKHYEVHLIVADGLGDELLDGVHIHDIGLRHTTRLYRARIDSMKAYRKAIEIDCESYHFHDPELVSITNKLRRRKKKLIYDVHEDLPRQIYGKPYLGKYIKPLVSGLIEYFENDVSKKMDYIITATPYIRDRFLKVNKNTIDINNFPLLHENRTPVAYSEKNDELCYVGGLFQSRGVFEIIESLQFSEVRLNVAGEFESDAFKQKCMASKGWKYVKYYGFVSREEIVDIFDRSKIGLVSLYPLINYLDSLPIKMFEYMLAGMPVIASNFPYWKMIVSQNQCGVNVDPKNPHEIANKVLHLLKYDENASQMGQNGRKAVLDKYNWCVEEEKLFNVYSKIIN